MSTSTIAAPSGTWALDPVHSTVAFQIRYVTGTFRGSFREFEGALDVTDEGARLTGSAQVASVDVRDDNLSAHLQSPDFFDAETHPRLSFAAERIALDGQAVEVAGELTIKGVTQAIVATGTATGPATDLQGSERIGLTLTATVDRNAFGVSWNADLPGGGKALADEVVIQAELYFVKAA